jgi:hypothetical protein
MRMCWVRHQIQGNSPVPLVIGTQALMGKDAGHTLN